LNPDGTTFNTQAEVLRRTDAGYFPVSWNSTGIGNFRNTLEGEPKGGPWFEVWDTDRKIINLQVLSPPTGYLCDYAEWWTHSSDYPNQYWRNEGRADGTCITEHPLRDAGAKVYFHLMAVATPTPTSTPTPTPYPTSPPSTGTPTAYPTTPPTPTGMPNPVQACMMDFQIAPPSPTPTPECVCSSLEVYNTSWQEITDLTSVDIGQTVYFYVEGVCQPLQTFDMAQFRINNGAWTAHDGARGNGFYYQFTVSSGGIYQVDALVHHPVLGWM
jgi:hypothetical protein